MRTMRAITAGLTVVALASPPAAFAARHATVSCDLVRDAAGDAQSVPGTDSGSLDLLSADVANDAKTVSVAIRLAQPVVVSTTDPRSRSYVLWFWVGGKGFSFAADYATGGSEYSAELLDGPADPVSGESVSGTLIGEIHGQLLAGGHEIRMTAPLSMLTRYVSLKQTYFSRFEASAAEGVLVHGQSVSAGPVSGGGVAGVVSTVDIASSSSRYLPGTPSCI